MERKSLVSDIDKQILELRSTRVILDRDVANIYEIGTKVLNKAVRRRISLFSEDFMWQLSHPEYERIKVKCGYSQNSRGRPYLPFVFTEAGVILISSVLRNPRALDINRALILAFAHNRNSRKVEDLNHVLKRMTYLEAKVDHLTKLLTGSTQIVKTPLSLTSKNKTGLEKPRVRKPELDIDYASHHDEQVKRIKNATCTAFKVECAALVGDSRKKNIVLARHMAILFIRKQIGLSLREIGYIFGKKNHTTIIHAIEKIEEHINTSEAVRRQYNSIASALNS